MATAKGKRKRNDYEEGGIGYILKALNGFQAYFSSAPTPSRIDVSKKFDLLKLNDDVYELCKPSGRPSVEVVFFHGFQLGGSRQTYATTWLSRNGSELWPNWIRKSVPEVRILLVSYDGSATRKDHRGGTDMYVTSENLVQSLTSNAAHVGQDGCPVILVGHSLGGLVIKEILLQAYKVLSFDIPENPNWRVRDFFENVKQLFYYSCPHNGTRLADDKRVFQKGQLFKPLKTLNKKAARRNEEFRKLRDKFKWGAYSIAEKLPADLGSLGKQVVVEEASARHDTDGYYTADADHFSVCQPASDTDSSFGKLMEIIDDAKREVVRGHQIKTPTTFVGLNDQITQVTIRLRTTQYLSICGIGGIGKSTLAMAVYNAISGNFEYTSFVSEVKKKLVGEQVSTENLEEEILKNLYHKGNKSKHAWDRLKGKRVLIVLDDVENESQVFVMPKIEEGVGFFSDESRVLVTSRNRKIISSKDFEVHNAQFLGNEASRRLFCSHAFKEEHAPGPYEDDVEKLVGKCGGLPLALEVTGKYLYKQEGKAMWNGAFQRLSAAQSLGGSRKDPLWSIFEVIYEDLQEEEQQMFLDIATCFHGDHKQIANLVWRSCDWVKTADMGWQNLVDIGFVRAADDYYEVIWMHELLRDFGRMKANPGNIESNSRVCCYEDSKGLPPWPFTEGTTPLVKFLRIVGADWRMKSNFDIDIERLRGLENLKVLFLEGVNLYGAFNLLPDKLEVLIMRYCRWTPGSSKSLYDAEDHDYDTEDHDSDAEDHDYDAEDHDSDAEDHDYDTENHDSYAEDHDSNAEDHDNIPSESWRSTLGESSAPKSGRHDTLRHIGFLHDNLYGKTPGNPLFPDLSFEHLPALQYLRISVVSRSWNRRLEEPPRVVRLPDNLGQFKSLRELDICWQNLTHLPESLGQLGSLQKLAIGSETLTCLPESLGQLRSLQELEIDCCSLTRLPDSLGQLKSLRELEIDCRSLTRISDSLRQLQRLPKLKICCSSLTHLPDSLGQLRSLQKLVICCSSLTCLPDSLKQLDCLELLEISHCYRLRALPDTLGQLGHLELLEISHCHRLRALPDTLGQLGGLQELRIDTCRGLTALPDNLGQLRDLRVLEIKGNGLTTLPHNLGHLGCLQRLVISECYRLETLPDALGDLHALQYLEVTNCRKLKALPDTVMKLHCMKIFERNFMDETNSYSVDNLDSSDETDSDSVDNLDSSDGTDSDSVDNLDSSEF